MKVSCIIVDDEFPARALLQDFIGKFAHLELLGSFKSPLEALPLLQQDKVDVMFLDIQMPDITGIDFLKTLRQKPLVVLTTAYMEYAIEGYELDVLDYLVKPFAFERFMQTITKIGDRLAIKTTPPVVVAAEPAKEEKVKDFMMVKADHKIYRLKYKDILYIEGLREYVAFYCKDEKIVSLESLRKLETNLPDEQFFRVHKSYIVNMEKVLAIYGNQLKLEGVTKYIPIGKSYKEAVHKKLMED